jgi:hypothetical protein
LSHKFLKAVRDPRVAKQLANARVGLLKVLGADEETGQRNQSYEIVFRLPLEVGQLLQMGWHGGAADICVEEHHRVVQALRLHLQLFC